MEALGESPDPSNLPNLPLEYYLMQFVGESPNKYNLPRRPLEYYLMLMIGESPNLLQLPNRPLEYYLMIMIGDVFINDFPRRPLDYYLALWVDMGMAPIFFRVDSNGDLIGTVKEPGLDDQFSINANGELVYSGSDPVYSNLEINASGNLVG